MDNRPLSYHPDTTQKHTITDEELAFLKNLQKELNTQDTLSQADPRYWSIRGFDKVYGSYNGSYQLFLKDTYYENIEDAKSMLENIFQDILSDNTVEIKFQKSVFSEYDAETQVYVKDFLTDEMIKEFQFDSITELAEYLSENGEDSAKAVLVEDKPIIYPDTMFLTRKAALEHLEKNGHHYCNDAHTFCMTAWRNPEMEHLISILRTVDFDKIPTNS